MWLRYLRNLRSLINDHQPIMELNNNNNSNNKNDNNTVTTATNINRAECRI